MFHFSDNTSNAAAVSTPRQAWLALLARAPQALLESALGSHGREAPDWLRRPETGLMMVQGRVGGTGERFNLGEVTVTRCALRLRSAIGQVAPVGVAFVLGRNHTRAQMAAVADALLQDPVHQRDLQLGLLEPLRAHLAEQAARRHARAQTTRVDFFTVARESGRDGQAPNAAGGEA